LVVSLFQQTIQILFCIARELGFGSNCRRIRVCQYCQIIRVWVLGFGDVVVLAFNDAIASKQSTRFAACELVLGFSVAWLSGAPVNVCTGFSKSGFFTSFSYKFCKWRSPKSSSPLNKFVSDVSLFCFFCFVDCVARQEEEEDESLSVAAQDCDALVTSLPKLTMTDYSYVLAMLWYTW
jgi:hypothetical protein